MNIHYYVPCKVKIEAQDSEGASLELSIDLAVTLYPESGNFDLDIANQNYLGSQLHQFVQTVLGGNRND